MEFSLTLVNFSDLHRRYWRGLSEGKSAAEAGNGTEKGDVHDAITGAQKASSANRHVCKPGLVRRTRPLAGTPAGANAQSSSRRPLSPFPLKSLRR